MRIFTVASIAASSAAIAMLTACSGGPQSGAAGLPQTSANAAVHAPRPVPHAANTFVYVSDYSKDSIEILQRVSKRWVNVGAIKESVLDPLGVWIDRSRNLYVANGAGPATEYDSTGKLIFAYDSAGSAKGITTDKSGNVYVAGVDVSKYPQGVDDAFSCKMPNAEPRSIAVDKDGDVFVGAFLHNGQGKIVEYVHGLNESNCSATRLPIKFGTAVYGIALDNAGNLLVTDPERGGGDIDVIAPPYTSITRKINSRGPWPQGVSLNKANTRLYVTDSSIDVVQVLSYPTGEPIATLDDTQDLVQPTGTVDNANYVP